MIKPTTDVSVDHDLEMPVLHRFGWFTYSIITLVAISVMIALAASSIGKPYVMDEMEFPSVAQAIADTGKPVYYRGETARANIGLWHPPLYIAWYAVWFEWFGDSIEVGRSFGLFNSGLALVAIGIFFAQRQRKTIGLLQHIGLVAVLFVALLVASTSPLLVHGSILPDIDTQVLPLTLTVFILVLFELRRRNVSALVYWGIFVIGVMVQLYAKLPALIILLPVVITFEIVNLFVYKSASTRSSDLIVNMPVVWRRLIVNLFYMLISVVVAISLFMLSWVIIAAVWGVNYSLPFSYLTQSTNNPVNFAGSQNALAVILASAPEHFTYAVQWIGYPAFALIALLLVRETYHPGDGLLNRAERAALIIFLVFLLFLYIILRPAPFVFPKYWPPLIFPLALLTLDLLMSLGRGRWLWQSTIAIAIGVIAYLGYIRFNPETTGQDFILSIYTQWPKTPIIFDWQVLPMIVALVFASLAAVIVRRDIVGLLALSMLAIMLGWQIDVVSRQTQASYSTTYMYGEESLAAVTEYLRESLPEGAILIAPKDVGYRLQDRWRYIELTADPRRSLDQANVQVLVMRTNDYYGNTIRDTPEVAAAVTERFIPDTIIGNFAVLVRRPE